MNRRSRLNRPALAALIVATLALPQLAQAEVCGGSLGQNSWGRPLDYRDPKEQVALQTVERHHFTHEIEHLIRGLNGKLPGDIHYTLMRFVNHYRALNSMANWELKHGFTSGVEHLSAECYFERAVAFTPEDPTIYLIWGNFLYRKKDYPQALEIYKEAEKLDAENAEVHYNLGLLYIQLGELDKAREHADRAYSLGHPLPGLRNKLDRLSAGR